MTDLQFSQTRDRVGSFGLQEHFIDGVFVPSVSGETFESLNPASSEVLAVACAGGMADVDAAVGVGGKSPVVVFDDADPKTELGPLIGPEHHARVLDYIDSARHQGARVLAGGDRPPELPEGNFLQATVIADVDEHMKVFCEEIFGPVLVAMPFSDEADAIRLANATQYGLAAYVWTNDIRRAHRVAHAIDAGMCWINSQNVRDLRTPFGGVKASGIGREGGDYAFDFYCETEIVHVALGTHHIPRLGLDDPE